MTQQLEAIINQAWEDRAQLSPKAHPIEVRDAKHLNHILAALRASPLVTLVRRVSG